MRTVVTVQRHLVIINTVEVLLVNILHAVPVVFINITASAVETEVIRICRITASRDTLRVGVLIPACDTRNRNDGLEVCYTGRRNCKVGRAAVGTTGHSNVAVRPVSLNLNVVLLIGICNTAAVLCQPFNDALECVSLNISAAGLQALGTTSAQTAYLNNGIAANKKIVVPVEVLIVVEVAPGTALIRADIIPLICRSLCCSLHSSSSFLGDTLIFCLTIQAVQIVTQLTVFISEFTISTIIGAAGDIRTCVHDGCKFMIAFFRCSTGNLHQSLYQIELAIAVGVVVGLNINRVADDIAGFVAVIFLLSLTAGVRKNRLCNAVYKQRLTIVNRSFQTDIRGLGLHSLLFLIGACCIRIESVTDDGQRFRNLDIVVVARKLFFLHTCL